jgi:hypothetical protein
MREWRYSSIILDHSIRWRWLVSFTPRPLYPRGKSPRYPLDMRFGEPQSQSGRSGEENNLLILLAIELRFLDRPASSLVVISTELSRLVDLNDSNKICKVIVRVFNKLSITPWRPMGEWSITPPFLTSLPGGDEWSASGPGRFNPGERAVGTHWIGGWVVRRAGLDASE